ncbi:MAG: hypothetical protein JST55_07175 [Bacteroidetes bacterium]|nr:hypothetical protein [Bacteroidota bacterium]
MNKPEICIPGSSNVKQTTANIFKGIFTLHSKVFYYFGLFVASIFRYTK